ncbi:gliding motility-associated C-terminal domain-containing protein [Chryseobacterium taichungense]|uniref:Gliding motility-associated C-terminal domain-containing protein n=1 Tax=Chryseobacterium taichungense TaxID=295069 RepID=A0A1H7Y6L5_9FLAO|nr:choice-of-anchor L domain-containing protein [Chryseobacterium taichungense]SEM41643.1 gliding motility-associated C-terminal domain-containing protein [Chryseobacterium taichungense]
MLNYRLKNYFLFLVLLFVSGSAIAQKASRKNGKVKLTSESMKAGAFIDVNVASYTQSSYTPQQLVQQVLINGQSSCATPSVSNVTVSPNQPVTNNDRFWGYFHKGTTNFPFEDGIVLTTGYAREAGNAAISENLHGSISMNGDADLAAATNTNINNQRDAVALEFDFVPNSNQVKFNYIFASEEYSLGYPCNYSDAFALLIKPVAGGPYTNVAILPGTAGPVSVTNIRPDTEFDGSPLSCGAMNPTYFAGYNTSSIETNYNGRVVPLTAIADVTPGVAYHFKMVLSDYNDQTLDSAVFLEGGSFDIGIKIVDQNGVILPDTVNMCDNTPQVLTALLTAAPGMTFQWYKDGAAINGATNISYTATSPGAYEVKVAVPGNQCPASAVITIVGGTTPPAQNATLKLCTTPSVSAFNLNDARPLITTSTSAILHYYVNQADAVEENDSYLSDAAVSSYSGTDGQVLYVVVSNGAFCSKLVTLTLRKEATPVAQLTATKMKICLGESTTLTAANGVTYEWTGVSGTGATYTVSPTQTTTYSVYAIGAQGCKSLQPASVTIEVVPAITSNLSGGMICQGDVITLDAGAGPNYTYLWNTGDTSQTISVGTPGTYSVTVNNGVCSKVYTTQIIQAIIPEIINVNYNENGTMIFTASNPSNGPLEYSIDNGLTWQNSNTFSNVPRNTVVSIRVRVKKTSCVGFLEYFTFVMQNVITPNGDNINDIIDFRGVNQNKDFKASIFDRYGKEVYKASGLQPYWDGYFQGKRLPTSSYWYQVSFEDPASKKPALKTGWILLKNIE